MHKKCIKNPKNVTNFVITHIRCDKLGTKFGQILSLQNHYICKKCDKYFDVSNYCDKFCHIGDKNVTKSKPSQTAWLCGF